MHEMLNPKHWKRPAGYSNTVAAQGRMVFVAGQVGWNAEEVFETDQFHAQVRQALANVREALAAAGALPEHLVRLTWYVTDKRRYLAELAEVGAAYRDEIGRVFPAMSLIPVPGLLEDRALVEIEATAVIPAS
ncbi:MAG: RidA family protein [Gammaproteobacteria bacterium]|nr:RidA family protein [Gammaproteobacteria bacterium]